MQKWTNLTCIIIISTFVFSFNLNLNYSVDENRFVIHKVDPKKGKLKMFWKKPDGEIIGSLKRLKDHVESLGDSLKFAMNGGMYLKDQSPQGLYIENGEVLSTLENRDEGYGNFYLQPNGLFFIDDSLNAYVVTREDFEMNNNLLYATQSGPMLLIDGEYHEKLRKGSSNLHIRNGVGILPNGEVMFAISKEKVNFYDLATLFKQNGCKNALYLDGFVSRAYLPSKDWKQLDGNFGVIIGEIE